MAAFVLLAAARGERLPLRLFTSVEGLASNSVNRIVRDSRRYLWFCTGEGLSRFDGSEFTTYRTDHGLPGRSVTDLLETRDGEYWAGTTSGGVAHFLPRTAERVKFETVPTSQEKGALHVNAMAQTEDGRIWCGTNAGLFRLEGTRPGWKFRHVDLGPMPEPWAEAGIDALLAGRAGNLWAGGPGGLWRIGKDGERARWTDRHGLTSPAVLSLRQERRGGLWAGTERGLCRLAADPKPDKRLVERCYTTRDGLPSDYTQELLVASSGELWAGTLHGAAMAIRGASGDVEGFDAITVRRGLSDDNIAGLAEDVEGNLWLGSTDDGGAMRLARLGAVMYGERDGLDSANVISVFEDRQGAVRAMTRSSKGLELHRFDGRRFIAAELRVPSGENRWSQGVEQVALEDRSGRWWVATGGGLLEYSQPERSDPRAVHLIPDPLSNGKNVFRVFQDAEGNIWWSVSSRGRSGLARWERRSRKTRIFSENDGLPSLQTSLPTAFTQDRSGAVWFGLMRGAQGVIRYRNGRFELFDAGPGGPLGVLRASHLDSSGRLWFGAGLGLWRVDQPEMDKPLFRRMGMDEGLSSPSIHALTEDRLGRIYAVSGSAVDRIDLKTGKVRHYTTADGLPLGTLQSAHRDRTGALWFGSHSRPGAIDRGRRTVPNVPAASRYSWAAGERRAGVDFRIG